MAIEWQDDLATGIDLIDEQHKGIFDRFAEFKKAYDEGCVKEDIVKLLLFLEDYTRDHFREEEEALQEAGYAELSAQQEAHKMFLNDIADLKRILDRILERRPFPVCVHRDEDGVLPARLRVSPPSCLATTSSPRD
jgi:hemerythrin-like metal-binding protein